MSHLYYRIYVNWSRNEDLKSFMNATILVEASHYIEAFIYHDATTTSEPLLTALGGCPFTLRKNIEADLDHWKANHMTPIFVFEGQSTVGKDEMAQRTAIRGAILNSEAFGHYEGNDVVRAVKTFGQSGK